ncbi:MAG: transposase [Pyrinomonadaceae bacterium]|nr:transposase [Pyrinomonadaceae bacterium]
MNTAKTIKKSYKFRIYPTKAQTKTLEMTLDLCRELYNAALQERRDAWKLERKSISLYDQQNQLPKIKKIREDLNSVYSQVLREPLRSLDNAFSSFFSRVKKGEKAGFPRFKSQNRFNSFCYPQSGFDLVENNLKLSKIGKIKIKLSRNIVGKIKTCTIKREIDKWFVFFVVETKGEPLPKTGKEIGLDVGLENFVTLSDGMQINNSRYLETAQKQLRKAQRRVSRRKKGSHGRRKAVLQVKKIHQKIRNQRADFQHKLSTNLIKNYDLIAIEKLNIRGMSKGIFSKQINDVAWSNFFNMLRYKAESADKKLVEVNPNGTSQICICGERVEKDLSIRVHHCQKCGLKENRDIVSAKVILERALGQSVKTQT